MYTVCYTDEAGLATWDRFANRNQVLQFLRDNSLEEDEDVIVFQPEADECTLIPSQIFSEDTPTGNVYEKVLDELEKRKARFDTVQVEYDIRPKDNESFADALRRQLSRDQIESLRDELAFHIERPGSIAPTKDFSLELDALRFSAHLRYNITFKTKTQFRIILDDLNEALG